MDARSAQPAGASEAPTGTYRRDAPTRDGLVGVRRSDHSSILDRCSALDVDESNHGGWELRRIERGLDRRPPCKLSRRSYRGAPTRSRSSFAGTRSVEVSPSGLMLRAARAKGIVDNFCRPRWRGRDLMYITCTEESASGPVPWIASTAPGRASEKARRLAPHVQSKDLAIFAVASSRRADERVFRGEEDGALASCCWERHAIAHSWPGGDLVPGARTTRVTSRTGRRGGTIGDAGV